MTDLTYEVADQIATITLNRPEKFNAFTLEMVDEWADRLAEAQADPEVRVIVVTGAGKGFCSGIDLAWVDATDTPLAHKRVLADRIHRVALTLERVDKPVLAAVNGAAFGAGLDMALMCDVRFAARSAKVAESYVRVGLIPGDGGAWYLPRLVGLPRALELLWTGDTITAERGEQIGIFNQVFEDDELMEATYAFARRLAAGPPVALAMIKRMTYQSLSMDLRAALELASSQMALIRSTEDSAEAYRAFKDKREGNFTGR